MQLPLYQTAFHLKFQPEISKRTANKASLSMQKDEERRWRRKDKNSTNLGGFFFYRSVNSHSKVSYKHYTGTIHWQAFPTTKKEDNMPLPRHLLLRFLPISGYTHCNTIADLTGMRLDDSWMGPESKLFSTGSPIAKRAESAISENLIYIYDVASLRTVLLAVRTFMNGCLPGCVCVNDMMQREAFFCYHLHTSTFILQGKWRQSCGLSM